MLVATPLAAVAAPATFVARRPAPPREPGTDYPRLGGVQAMHEILARLAAQLPPATAAAFPAGGEDGKLKAS